MPAGPVLDPPLDQGMEGRSSPLRPLTVPPCSSPPAGYGHADLGPLAPVDRHGEVPATISLLGEGIQEGVGRAVVGLAGAAVEGDRRGAEDHEVQRLVAEELVEHEGPGDLGGEHRGGRGGLLLDDAAAGDTGRVDHPVEGTKARAGTLESSAHLLAVRDVGGEDQNLAAEGREGLERPDPLADGIGFAVLRQPLSPVLGLRRRRAAEKDKPGLRQLGQALREDHPDAADATGDEVHPTPSQASREARGLVQPDRLSIAHPAGRAA